MAETREREQRFNDRMSDHEALMWNIEKDPWLNPSGAAVTILKGTIDEEHFRRTLRRAVAKMPRLYERVVPGLGRLAPPTWVPDPEFDIEYHMRRLRAAEAAGPTAALRPRRPAVPGAARPDPSAVAVRRHRRPEGRAVGDLVDRPPRRSLTGSASSRMAEMYQQLRPERPSTRRHRSRRDRRRAVEAHHAKQLGGDLTDGFASTVGQSLAHLVRRELGVVRRVAGEVVDLAGRPTACRARDTIDDALGAR